MDKMFILAILIAFGGISWLIQATIEDQKVFDAHIKKYCVETDLWVRDENSKYRNVYKCTKGFQD